MQKHGLLIDINMAKNVSIFLSYCTRAFIKQYLIDGRFLKGRYGFVYSLLFTQYTFNKYAILYDLKKQSSGKEFLDLNSKQELLKPIDRVNKKSTLSLVMILKKMNLNIWQHV